jgi:hypothetical protein
MKNIARLLIIALVTSIIFAAVPTSYGATHDQHTTASNEQHPEHLIVNQLPEAAIPSKDFFRPVFFVTISLPNFSKPTRRAPIRRKGRVQH